MNLLNALIFALVLTQNSQVTGWVILLVLSWQQ